MGSAREALGFLLHCEDIPWGSKVLAAPTIRGGHVYDEGAADKIQSGGDSGAVWVRGKVDVTPSV